MTAPSPLPAIPDLPGDLPVLLFPVRLETRYRDDGAGGTELCCRIYPAAPELDTHEPELTSDEATLGAAYQSAVAAAASVDETHAAWLSLCAQLGAPRAAWVARATAPGAPDPGSRKGSWTRPAQAIVLPDFWVALGYRAGNRIFAVSGKSVASDPMPAGPVPGPSTEAAAAGPGADTPLADEVTWLVDYDRAVTDGMAITVPLGAGPLNLDRLVVLGAKGLAPDDGAARVTRLLDAQLYTSGAALLTPGTPTNNTPEAPAGYSSGDEPHDPAQAPPAVRAGDGSDGSRLAAALGLDPTALTGIPGIDATAGVGAQAMNALLWPATVGQFLRSMAQPAPDDASRDDVRRMFVDWVRADGPLPILRLGTDPRGVLPVLARDALTDPTDPDILHRLATMLATLLTSWTAAGAQHGPDSAPATELLARTGVGWTIEARADLAVDPAGWYQHATAVMGLARATIDQLLAGQYDRQRGAQYLLGFAPTWVGNHVLLPGVADEVPAADGPPYPVTGAGPLSLTGAAPADTALPEDYLGQLIAQSRAAMTAETFRPSHDTLLYLLARHALLTAVAAGGAGAEFPRPQPTIAIRGGFGADDGAGDDELTEALAGANHLSGRPPATLARLLAQTLDLTGARLDAWLTAFATRRLSAVRADATTAKGVLIGGWSVVENLAPTAPLTTVAQPPPGEAAGLLHDPNNAGYLLTPSIAQAATAAVLRSGYLTYRTDDPDFALDPSGSPLSIDLSSRRVRTADYLLDGMRQGQQLGALLGYRLERALHENSADGYIAPFRALAPLNPSGNGVTTDVTDGLALSRLRHSPAGLPWGARAGSQVLGPQLPAVTAALDDVDQALDAVADALLGEAIHQSLVGNPAAARAAIDAASRGDGAPPELEFVRTPRTGFAVTHRVIVPWAAVSTAPAGWTVRLRGVAEPAGSAWVAALLGEPQRYAGAMLYTDSAGAGVTVPITLADLQLSPLDIVAAAAEPDGLAAYAAWALRSSAPDGVGTDAIGQLVIRPVGADTTIADALAAAAAIGQLLGASRALDARDVAAPGTAEAGVDTEELSTRHAATVTTLQDVCDRILAASPAGGPIADRAALELALADAYFGGVSGAAPPLAGSTDAVVAAQGQAVADELRRRLARADPAGDAGSEPQAVCAQIEALLGAGIVVAPVCALPTPDAVSTAVAATDPTTADSGQDLDAWLGRLALVRPSVSALEDVFACGEALGSGPPLLLTVGQLPVVSGGAPWVGLPLAAGSEPAANSVSLVFAPGTIDVASPSPSLAGLVVDEWTETIPAAQEQVASTFHFNAPGAQAPQTVLLVVPPSNAPATWHLEDYETAILDALDLTRARAADLTDLAALAPFLPAAYVGGTAAPWTDPTRFAGLPVEFGSYDVADPPTIDSLTTSAGDAAGVEQGEVQTLIVAGQNLDGAAYSAGSDVSITATAASATGATLTVQPDAAAAIGTRPLQASNLGGLTTISFNVLPRPLVTGVAPDTIAQQTASGPTPGRSTVTITVRGQGLTDSTAVGVTGAGVTVSQFQVVDDATISVALSVPDAAPYISTWDPTQPDHPTKPPLRPRPVHAPVALHLTVTVDRTVVDAGAGGVQLTLDTVDNNG